MNNPSELPRHVTPAMQAWIDEQKKNFKPSDLDAAVRLLRAYDRANREHDRGAGVAA
ncbi:hypothetical protein [Nocardia acidivorans]|uniref:hypothetical protein n=1 Tax=Nocardia acidivorans TaxID=404580 RepID=UPI000B0AE716|nr:hypothetical protein [Nocardia acidivorans]